MGERCKCHVSLAIAYSVHGPSQELVHLEAGLKLVALKEGRLSRAGLATTVGLLSVVEAAHSRIAISLLAVPQLPLSGQVTA